MLAWLAYVKSPARSRSGATTSPTRTTRRCRRFLPNLQSRRFWVESENRWIRLRVSQAGLRLIDKKGIDVVLAELRASGVKI